MLDAISQYITEINQIHQAGNATEHSYRPALLRLLQSMMPGLDVTNEPKRIDCGAPDFIITCNEIPVGYVEAKDIGVNLEGRGNKQNRDQLVRYKQSLENLIVCDYLTFQWYLHGELRHEIILGKQRNLCIVPELQCFGEFSDLIQTFSVSRCQNIKDSEQLSQVLAARARLLAGSIEKALNEDETAAHDSTISGQLQGFREVLIHDIKPKEFSDIYAQTIAYGMFAARLNDTTNMPFTRTRAAELIPHSNPFLRKLFQYVAGYDLDVRIDWVTDALADLFNYVDIASIQSEFGQKEHDPIIHFYETFLAKYDPALRKSRGVWYTPQSVVRFIVQSVDKILQQEFGLAQGLADHSKVKLPVREKDKRGRSVTSGERECHRVQILDPAAGTGTFLAEAINTIHSRFTQQQGMWAGYCEEHLIPRLNGFEILMASYAMAHFKLSMTLKETGFMGNGNTRLHVYLTNTLEEAPGQVPQLFMAQWLAREAEEARRIKRDVPVMVVMGNPPYNVSTQNKNDWIDGLIADYKKEPGTEKKLKEQKLNLDDDYVKFIRYGQMLVEKTETGILAYITNHGFLDNPTFRGMRWSLLQSFDKIYILNLHGSTTRNEVVPQGVKDENVFDIKIGTSISICIKTGKKAPGQTAEIFHAELTGKQKKKYAFLQKNTLDSVKWKKIVPHQPFYFLVPKDFQGEEEYEKGFSVTELFPLSGPGVKTERDKVSIHFTEKSLQKTITDFLRLDPESIRDQFDLPKDSRDWKIAWAKKDLTDSIASGKKLQIQYRPFDFRYTFYTGKSRGFIGTPGAKTVKHLLAGENVGLVLSRQFGSHRHFICFATSKPIEISSQPFAPYSVFPLYLYPDQATLHGTIRTPNLEPKIVATIAKRLGLQFTEEKEKGKTTFAPIDLLDYIYAVLHSPAYREKYKEFLKIDFPRVPYPEEAKTFWKLVSLGEKLRRLHLMEGVTPHSKMANFPVPGTNEVEALQYDNGKVYINDSQYFDNVSSDAWSFYIGGYQPAQKWLKDRKGRTLNFDDIQHYQKIIHILNETEKVMSEVDEAIS